MSLQSALGYYGLIPEFVPVVTSITTRRPGEWTNPVGRFVFRHIRPDLFFGYASTVVSDGQSAFIATPEKALLDLIYLQPGGVSLAFLSSLRLQNLEQFDLVTFEALAERAAKPKLLRAVSAVSQVVSLELEAHEAL